MGFDCTAESLHVGSLLHNVLKTSKNMDIVNCELGGGIRIGDPSER